MLKEYYKVNEIGTPIDSVVLDADFDEIPEMHVEGWGGDLGLHSPRWDFKLNKWVEGRSSQSILDAKKKEKFDSLSLDCQNAILGYFKAPVNGIEYEFSFDREAQSNFTGALIFMSQGMINSVEWTAWKDGVAERITISKEQFMPIIGIAFAHKDKNISKLRSTIQEQLNGCDTIEEIESLKWENASTIDNHI